MKSHTQKYTTLKQTRIRKKHSFFIYFNFVSLSLLLLLLLLFLLSTCWQHSLKVPSKISHTAFFRSALCSQIYHIAFGQFYMQFLWQIDKFLNNIDHRIFFLLLFDKYFATHTPLNQLNPPPYLCTVLCFTNKSSPHIHANQSLCVHSLVNYSKRSICFVVFFLPLHTSYVNNTSNHTRTHLYIEKNLTCMYYCSYTYIFTHPVLWPVW